MNFMLGCNYWASNAGVDMWKDFDPDMIKRDLRSLHDHGISYLRVFPLWRDFQPVKSNLGGKGRILEYVMEDGSRPQNDYFLDEEMMDRFSQFLDLCDTYGLKVIVGLITGWMSGGLFVPSALYGKNVITDPVALYYEQLFVKGFVGRFKSRQAICGWDLGNECSVMGDADTHFAAASWAASIANAIRASDSTRPVISGMHNLTLDGVWRIQDQAEFTDVLTTHPYPMWCRHTSIDAILGYRTTMHATAQAKYYADIGGKPCLTEEIGTMGPLVCSEENAANFIRLNLFSLWANGSTGVFWWCNHDFDQIDNYPYSIQMLERELGLLTSKNEPKPAIGEFKKFREFLEQNEIELPKAQEHGVCLLTKGQDHWGIAYMTYILAKTLGLNLKFSYIQEQAIPDSKLYFLPSVAGMVPMPKKAFEELLQRVNNGADLYISVDNGSLTGFETFAGLKVTDSYSFSEKNTVDINGKTISVNRTNVKKYESTTADVLAYDDRGNPFITVNHHGKGKVYFIAAPIEANLIGTHNAFNGDIYELYRKIFHVHTDALPVEINAREVVFTVHPENDGAYFVAINHSDAEKELHLDLKGNYEVERVIYGNAQTINPFDACILKLKSI